ncbi:cellulose-binding domain-containing protein, partial [Saccharothrix sp. MB29]|nr:cellulose-binding domain-containing protein [Saccharothrix sp. MB29]
MKRSTAAVAALGVVLGAGAVVLPQATAAAQGCRVDYTVTSQWQGGFQAGVKITNLGDPVNGWSLGIAFPSTSQRVTQGWNATWSQSGSTATATNTDWNRSLATGGSTDIGFVGSWSGGNPTPTSFTLNGVACTGSTGPTTTTTTTTTA